MFKFFSLGAKKKKCVHQVAKSTTHIVTSYYKFKNITS